MIKFSLTSYIKVIPDSISSPQTRPTLLPLVHFIFTLGIKKCVLTTINSCVIIIKNAIKYHNKLSGLTT